MPFSLSRENQMTEARPMMWSSGTKPKRRESDTLAALFVATH